MNEYRDLLSRSAFFAVVCIAFGWPFRSTVHEGKAQQQGPSPNIPNIAPGSAYRQTNLVSDIPGYRQCSIDSSSTGGELRREVQAAAVVRSGLQITPRVPRSLLSGYAYGRSGVKAVCGKFSCLQQILQSCLRVDAVLRFVTSKSGPDRLYELAEPIEFNRRSTADRFRFHLFD